MGNFVTLLHRSDFNDLFKFGHLFVHNVVPFEGELIEHSEDKMLFDAVTAYMNTYDYSTEYLILHFKKYSFSGSSVEIFIKDVVSIFALDKDAHVTLSASLDPRINLQVSCWSNFFMDLKMNHSIRQSKAGMFNCFEIFGISEEERKQVSKLIAHPLIKDLFIDLFNQKRPEGDKSIWTYLLRYERHHPYWKDMRGYFSDAIHVFENYKQKHEIDYEIADEVPLGDKLLNCGNNFSEIHRTIMATNPSEYKIDGCNYFAVAPLFLYMSDLFRDGGITISKLHQNEHLINGSTHEKYKIDFALAVALLGIKLGQELTYSCYYESQKLAIFNKTIIQPSKINKELPIVDPDDGKALSSEEAQDLLNSQYKKIEELSDKVQELEQNIHQEQNEESQSQQENKPQQVVQDEPTDIGNESQQVVQDKPTDVDSEPQQVVQNEPTDVDNNQKETYKSDETVVEPTQELPIKANITQEENEKNNDMTNSPEEVEESNNSEVEDHAKPEYNLEHANSPVVEEPKSTYLPDNKESVQQEADLNEIEEKPFVPVEMRKLNSQRTAFDGRNKKTITVTTPQQYAKFKELGYESINYFDTKTSTLGSLF